MYTVTDLGTYADKAGQTLSGPRAINSAGQLAGINVIGGSYRGLVYGGSWTNLGTLGGTDSYAAAINGSARVVGYSLNASGLDHAFLWTPGGTGGVPGNVQMKDLGTLGGNSSEAYEINQAGQITGYAQNGQNDRAFLYSGGVMTDIGSRLGSSLPNSYGYGINDSGHIAGTAYNSSYSLAHAFFYNGTTAVDIGSFGQGANGLAINNNDQITGYSTTSASVDHAFRYASGVLKDLGTLGGHWSYGNGINNSNVIVGGSFIDSADSIYHAFVTSGNSLTDLNTNVNSSGAGWVLVEARAINDAGQIAGVGTLGAVNHSFLLSPLPLVQITRQPTDIAVACQGNASFSVTATPLPLSYQWYKGNPPAGTTIPNATNNVLTLTNVTGAQTGPYYVVARSAVATVTSSVATLTVIDSAAPVISGCPIDITNATDLGLCSGAVTWTDPTAVDACDGVVPVSCVPTNGARFSKGLTVVTCSAHDGSGNTNTCSFTVAVVDNQGPVISGCPGDLTSYITPGSTSAVVTWTMQIATDNCDGNVPVVCTPPSGSHFTVGSTSITCRANDTSGNNDSCSFSVNVTTTEAPLITDFKVAATNVIIRFSTIVGGQYTVQASGGLTGSWTDELTGISGTGASVTATNFGGATFLPRFFRIKLSLP
jgi:probable HAF family extracellular repeat protein